MKIVGSIDTLLENTFKDNENTQYKYEIGKIKQEVAEKVKEATTLSVADYVHIIDNYAIKHIIGEHGDAQKESRKGQLPVTLDYFRKITEVVSNPDVVMDGGKSKIGRRIIVYVKRINGSIIYVEEVRTKRKELALLSLYIKKPRQ